MRLSAIVLVASLVLAGPAAADTVITGGNIINQTWTTAGSPYVVQGDITIPAGSTLTIQSGVSVLFASTDAMLAGIDTARVELTVNGTLSVNGTAANPVQFSAQTGTAAQTWYGIVVGASATSAMIEGADIRHAVIGLKSLAGGTQTVVSQSSFSSNQYGVVINAGSPVLSGLTVFSQTADGIQFVGTGTGSVSQSVIRNNAQHGIYLRASGGSLSGTVLNCTVHQNTGSGIAIAAASGATANTLVRNSNITGNAIGIDRTTGTGTTAATVDYSNVWNNGTNYSNASAGTGALSSNPLYVAPPGNVRLTSNSPSRFGGDGGQDIGALPYTGDPTPGFYGVLWSGGHVTLADSPAAIGGDLTIPPGQTLTLDPGVTLNFAASDVMAANAHTSRSELIVRGNLSAIGTPTANITLQGSTAAVSSWYGVRFLAGSSASTLNHAQIAHGQYGLDLSTTLTPPLRRLDIRQCGTGVRIANGSATLDAITLREATGHGLDVQSGGSAVVTNAVIRNNGQNGIQYSANVGTQSLSVVNATINANVGYGVNATATGPTAVVNVRNSIVTNNATGLAASGSASVTATYNDVWNNTVANYVNVSSGTGSISANPQFVAMPSDLHVQQTSVTIDTGTASGAPNHDRDDVSRPVDGDGINGTAYDLGAYEYLPVMPVTISLSPGVVGEGNGGTTAATLAVTLSGATGQSVSVDWTTTGLGTASAGTDFTAASGTITFAPNETSQSLPLSVLGDVIDEFDETVVVALSNPSGVNTLGTSQAALTITDDDAQPSVSVAEITLCESTPGAAPVSLDAISGKPVSVQATSSDGSATAGSDYAAIAQSVAIAAGSATASILIAANGDGVIEPAESLVLTLSSPINAGLGTATASVTILDDTDPLCILFRNGFE